MERIRERVGIRENLIETCKEMEEDQPNGETAEKLENGIANGSEDGMNEEESKTADVRINGNLEVYRELNKNCKIIGLCPRCQLRYLGESYSSTTFSLPLDEVRKVSNPFICPIHSQHIHLIEFVKIVSFSVDFN